MCILKNHNILVPTFSKQFCKSASLKISYFGIIKTKISDKCAKTFCEFCNYRYRNSKKMLHRKKKKKQKTVEHRCKCASHQTQLTQILQFENSIRFRLKLIYNRSFSCKFSANKQISNFRWNKILILSFQIHVTIHKVWSLM